ncbi:MAG: DUF3592 domain-containing protein, partial [bacterium]|nr:DUF3592 domain-containing protein [bacterium]
MSSKFTFGHKSRASGDSPGSKIIGTIVFGFFFIIGTFMFVMLLREVFSAGKTYFWPNTAAEVTRAEVVRHAEEPSDPSPYVINVAYNYYFGGNRLTSDSYSRKKMRFESYEDASAELESTVHYGQTDCYVNPDSPGEAILRRESLWLAFFIVLPLVFVLIGGGGVYFLWKGKKDETGNERLESIANKHKGKTGSGKFLRRFAIFLIGVGALLTYYVSGNLLRQYRAASWPEVNVTVIESSIQRHESTDDEGHTSISYRPDVFYSYSFAGQDYKASRYSYLSSSSSDRQKISRMIHAYQAGKTAVAYVDPDHPEQVVLSRDIGWNALLYFLPILPALVGWLIIRGQRKKATSGVLSAGLPEGMSFSPHGINRGYGSDISLTKYVHKLDPASGYHLLQPQWGRWGKFVAILMFALFWNRFLGFAFFNGAASAF